MRNSEMYQEHTQQKVKKSKKKISTKNYAIIIHENLFLMSTEFCSLFFLVYDISIFGLSNNRDKHYTVDNNNDDDNVAIIHTQVIRTTTIITTKKTGPEWQPFGWTGLNRIDDRESEKWKFSLFLFYTIVIYGMSTFFKYQKIMEITLTKHECVWHIYVECTVLSLEYRDLLYIESTW